MNTASRFLEEVIGAPITGRWPEKTVYGRVPDTRTFPGTWK
jgi:hypothetical protein